MIYQMEDGTLACCKGPLEWFDCDECGEDGWCFAAYCLKCGERTPYDHEENVRFDLESPKN